ncbi:hypothetical protein DP923_00835 [Pontibacter arcticus]|uniref:Uncharacterized protein n=1 Tax=Pontibacter arcticus TaxID=2080288 RepID=A0A364RH89_9BACT|nr:hypothetical protein DP923_00835 [Pontibacter arcticus]
MKLFSVFFDESISAFLTVCFYQQAPAGESIVESKNIRMAGSKRPNYYSIIVAQGKEFVIRNS